MTVDESYMLRCIELARLGAGNVAPNPMVGSVLVHNNRIIGEGYHVGYGMPHAEVNCIESVLEEDRQLISESTLYVSLEPCAHYGKTPPCADLIIKHGIPEVVVGCRDPFPEVDGKGIAKLESAGVKVKLSLLQEECRLLNKRFFTFHSMHRPYVVLKWAQTGNGFISGPGGSKLQITNVYSNRLVHRWRSEEAAILVGTRTAMMDDPALTNRVWTGKNPVRLVIDRNLKLQPSLQLFNEAAPTIIFNEIRNTPGIEKAHISVGGRNWYYQVNPGKDTLQQMMDALYKLDIQSVIVEGGAELLQSFIKENIWNEARVFTNETLLVPDGVKAPGLKNERILESEHLFSDRIEFYANAALLG
ncbi:MAG TPA: bifunctional diaminohydroxyphosphoribosylaminopyrimidine deaminase/5-amino-6-(5-phosphoribosylamino)uracil reductase RibD [Agriterribacter sp.]|nr:bifunctional diaminohydroxyphosphoribosylaminopyrimidine deaminase/5-amino-6-(5-phosphoribosylamino)uracil reductase RibD [Agriterribacter sp.]